MSGATKGAALLLQHNIAPALYLHCASHCLNLVTVKALQLRLRYTDLMIFMTKFPNFIFKDHIYTEVVVVISLLYRFSTRSIGRQMSSNNGSLVVN